MSDRTLTELLFIIGIVISLLIGFKDEIRTRLRTWDKASLEKVINKLKASEYAQQEKYLRDRSALIGLAILSGLASLQGVISVGILAGLPPSGRNMTQVSSAAQFQFGAGYIALMYVLNAIEHHRHANNNYIKRRLDRLTDTYKKYLQP